MSNQNNPLGQIFNTLVVVESLKAIMLIVFCAWVFMVSKGLIDIEPTEFQIEMRQIMKDKQIKHDKEQRELNAYLKARGL